MGKFTFIVNPYAGKGRGKRLLSEIKQAVDSLVPDAEIILTEGPLHALKIAAERKMNEEMVVAAVGGDGTVNEVGNGLMGGKAAIGAIPIGSGNDFVKMFPIPLSINGAVKKVVDGNRRSFDVGSVTINTEGGETNQRHFLNGIGIGFDAAVANQTTKHKRLKGFGLYVVSVAETLFRYNAPNMLTSLNGMHLNGRHFLIAIGNGKCAGGGFYLTPDAIIDDGLLDICIVDNLSVPQVIRVFPSVLKGKHAKFKEVKFFKTDEIEVKADKDIYVHADGEVLATKAREIVIKVIPSALTIQC